MMVRRCVLDKDKLLISKPGNDVLDPNLTDDEKVFDSRWPFAFGILQRGYYLGGEAPPNSQPFTTQHFFSEVGGRPLLLTEVIPHFHPNPDIRAGVTIPFTGTSPRLNDADNVNIFTAEVHKQGVDQVVASDKSQTIKMFDNRFEITWDGYNANQRTMAFIWFILSLPAAEQ